MYRAFMCQVFSGNETAWQQMQRALQSGTATFANVAQPQQQWNASPPPYVPWSGGSVEMTSQGSYPHQMYHAAPAPAPAPMSPYGNAMYGPPTIYSPPHPGFAPPPQSSWLQQPDASWQQQQPFMGSMPQQFRAAV